MLAKKLETALALYGGSGNAHTACCIILQFVSTLLMFYTVQPIRQITYTLLSPILEKFEFRALLMRCTSMCVFGNFYWLCAGKWPITKKKQCVIILIKPKESQQFVVTHQFLPVTNGLCSLDVLNKIRFELFSFNYW